MRNSIVIFAIVSSLFLGVFTTVCAQPKADFGFTPSSGCSPLIVQFSNTSTNANSYLWRFGNGNSSNQANPSAIYYKPGKYSVTLIAYGINLKVDSIVKTNIIEVFENPVSKFSVTPDKSCSPTVVQFKDLSTPGSGIIKKWNWDFGDGQLGSAQNPAHTYTSSGIYTASLYVEDVNGCKSQTYKTFITFGKKFIPSFISDFHESCAPPLTVKFTENTSGISGTKWTYNWDFGDGNTGAGKVASHTYTNNGSYDIKLTMKDSIGCLDSVIIPAYVRIGKEVPEFSFNSSGGCPPFAVSFTNKSTGGNSLSAYTWYFGDGDSAKGKDVTHVYNFGGTFDVTLVAVNFAHCKTSITKKAIITIIKPPSAYFTTPDTVACQPPLKVTFKDGSADAIQWYWNFGDSSSGSNLQNPTHTYNSLGLFTVKLTVTSKQGCTHTYTKPFLIKLDTPSAKFEAMPPTGCAPLKVSFMDQSKAVDGIKKWYWDFGDGTFDSSQSPSHIFNSGSFKIKLIITTRGGCVDSSDQNISIIAGTLPNPEFTASPLIKCPDSTYVIFNNTTNTHSPKATFFRWIFGDGDSAFIENPKHLYKQTGVYDVKLTACSNGCCSTYTRKQYITVLDGKAHFSFIQDGCDPGHVSFMNGSTGATNYLWKFGDGNVSTLQNPIHQYKKGIYVVRLHIFSTKTGCKDSTVDTLIVPAATPKPSADFNWKLYPTCTDNIFQFSPAFSDSVGFSFYWDFGILGTTTFKNPGKKINAAGNYKITLIVVNSAGCSDTVTKYLLVKGKPLQAAIYAKTRYSTCPPLKVDFYDSSLSGKFPIVKYEWWFSDGSYSTLQNPQKIFDKPGKYSVSHKISDSAGCTDSVFMKDYIYVKGPSGSYSFDSTEGCLTLKVQFKATSSNAIKFTWDFGDGTVFSGNPTVHTYTTPGMYIPLLILTDSAGCPYTLPPVDTIYVNPGAEPTFTYTTSCTNIPTQFTASAKTGVSSWLWDFGDGTTSTIQNPSHNFGAGDSFVIRLNTITNKGCIDVLTKVIHPSGLAPDFSTIDTVTCLGRKVNFNDKTYSDAVITSWLWDFGDGNTSTQQNPIYTYPKKGLYDVSLRVTNARGCTTTVVKKKFVTIGDTIAAPDIPIHLVTVNDDHSIRIEFSKYPDIDFGGYYVYRADASGKFNLIHSSSKINDTTFWDKGLNCLHQSYCYKVQSRRICDYYSNLNLNVPHCSVELKAKGGLNQVVLNWSNYQGWTGPVPYEIWKETPTGSNNFVYLTSVKPDITTYTDSTTVCSGEYHYKVMGIGYFLSQNPVHQRTTWSDTAAATPIHVNTVPKNEIVRATVHEDKNVVVEWKGVAGIKVSYFLLEKSVDGKTYEKIDTAFPKNRWSYEDKDVRVHKQPYYYRMRMIDSCGDFGPYSNLGKTILLKADTTPFEMLPFLTWTKYIEWKNNVSYYVIERKNADGNFVQAGRTKDGNDTTFLDEKALENQLPFYCYRVTAIQQNNDSVRSISNEDCAHPKSFLYAPSSFTPGSDGVNDIFKAEGLFISGFHMNIFNRWGEKIFQSENINEGWDGNFNGMKCPQDVYLWIISAKGVDGKNHYLNGNVTLIR